jgi:hypothetical protein
MADTLHEYKMRFAVLLQRYARHERLQHAAHVAKEVVGKEQANAYPLYVIQAAEQWPLDSEVIAEIDRLDLVPQTKEQILSEAYGIIVDRFAEKKDKLLAMRLYSDIMGWTTKQIKTDGSTQQEFLIRLEQLHNAVTNPVDT